MDTDFLLKRIANGESSAAALLLTRHEQRLRRMVALRFDPRLAARIDPSDVVQDTMFEAYQRLPGYAADPRIPFYPWLRGIAWDKLVAMSRRHVEAQRRSVRREEVRLNLSGDSQERLVERMTLISTTPSKDAIHREVRQRVRDAIDWLPPRDYEVIVLKHVEELTFPEIAAVLDVSEQAVYSQYRRAVQRLHRRLSHE